MHSRTRIRGLFITILAEFGTCFPEFIIVRPELVRLYWLGGDDIWDFSRSAAKGEIFPVGKAPEDPSSMRDFGFTVNDGLEIGAFTNTDGVESLAGWGTGFVASFDTVFVAAGALVVEGTELVFPFWVVCDAILDEIFPAANGDGVEVPDEVAFSVELAASPFPSSPSTAWLSLLTAWALSCRTDPVLTFKNCLCKTLTSSLDPLHWTCTNSCETLQNHHNNFWRLNTELHA